jgi:solute carrier family 35, member F1/2
MVDTLVSVIPLVGFAVCLFLLYAVMPLVISKTGVMAVNLNLLSADFYALLLGIFVFQYKVRCSYLI